MTRDVRGGCRLSAVVSRAPNSSANTKTEAQIAAEWEIAQPSGPADVIVQLDNPNSVVALLLVLSQHAI